MGTMNDFSFGWLTPIISYLIATTGAAIGLHCTVRALAATGTGRRNWLLTAAAAIGTGIWTMHFVAILGLTVDGTELRYDVPLTMLSLAVAIMVVGAGVYAVGYGRQRALAILLGGLGTGLGVAAMHYTGMAAIRIHGTFKYSPVAVALSVAIAILAATAGLWAAVTVRSNTSIIAAALVMGLAVSCMHYTGMAAAHVDLHPVRTGLDGAGPMEFVLPLSVCLGSFLLITYAFVALTPTPAERAAYQHAGEGPGETALDPKGR
ncbi:MHYT domain-containing protein [Kitasatospora sp. NPDC057904]|uniref:MHYT domain-containing protein n=1 Tax=unclassified Kitasatospora TaxID=2633591 RepID=UPI0036DD7E08